MTQGSMRLLSNWCASDLDFIFLTVVTLALESQAMGERLNIWILGGISFLLLPGALAGHTVRNVALRGPAVQSSDYGTNPARAVDGNRDPADWDTCTFTKPKSGPWWRVDLRDEYSIDGVAITSADNSQAALDGVEIWIGNSGRPNKDIRCAVISSFPKKRTLYVPCRGFEGRYVTVLLPGDGRVLSLCEVEVYPVHFAYPLPNVALKGEAAQSSTLSFSDASKAIDGRRHSFYSNGSCSHTAGGETDPWWRVDLRRTFIVMSIKVTNRGDCCAEKLDGAEIRIGNALENDGNSNPRCAVITRIRAGKTSTFRCARGGMAGRFVNIVIPGTKKGLALCEVEVYGAPEETPLQNVALNKPAKLSLESHFHSSAAVSGCRSVASSDCCEAGHARWWKVDLLAVYRVRAVTIINHQEDFDGTKVYIRNPGSAVGRCVSASPQQETLTHTFHCDDMEGRYVLLDFSIPVSSTKLVTLCEVEVYASAVKEPESAEKPGPTAPPPAPPSESVALNGRTVTVVGERLCWSDALLYCRRHHWDLLSLHSEDEQTEVARMLSHATFEITGGVWLGLRKYIMGKTWFWMSGDSMAFTHWPPYSGPHQGSSPCGSMDAGQLHRWVDRPCDQRLNFVCQSGGAVGLQRVPFNSYV